MEERRRQDAAVGAVVQPGHEDGDHQVPEEAVFQHLGDRDVPADVIGDVPGCPEEPDDPGCNNHGITSPAGGAGQNRASHFPR